MTYLLVVIAFGLGFLLGRWRPVTAARNTQQFASGRAVAAPLVRGTPVGVVSGLQTGTAPPGAVEGAMQVWLMNSGANKISTIKAIRSVTRLGLADAKAVCEKAPTLMCWVNTPADAEAVQRAFAGVAPVEVR